MFLKLGNIRAYRVVSAMLKTDIHTHYLRAIQIKFFVIFAFSLPLSFVFASLV